MEVNSKAQVQDPDLYQEKGNTNTKNRVQHLEKQDANTLAPDLDQDQEKEEICARFQGLDPVLIQDQGQEGGILQYQEIRK